MARMIVTKHAAVVITVAVVGLLGVLAYIDRPPAITKAAAPELSVPGMPTDREPERYVGSFLDSSLSAMLRRLAVEVTPEDKLYAFPDPSLGVGSQILVYRAQPVQIIDGGTTRLVRTWAATVEELIEEQRLELGSKDLVVPGITTTLAVQAEAHTITITRVAESEVTVTSTIAFSVQYKDDPTMERGTTVVEQPGKNGMLKTTYLVRRENGQKVSEKRLSLERAVEPVTEIIRRGTKVTVLDQGGASHYGMWPGRECGTNRFTAAHKTLPKGMKVKVTNVENGKSVIVTIDDRGPYIAGRVIDLTCDAFVQLAPYSQGTIKNVRIEKP
jgi:rare lipoprotein A